MLVIDINARSGKSGNETIALFGSEEETKVKKPRAVALEFPGLCAGEVSRRKLGKDPKGLLIR